MCASSNSNSKKRKFWNTPKPLFNPWRRVLRPCLPRYGINFEKANHFGRFDDYLDCNKHLDWSTKHVALDASPFVVSLISHTGAQRLFMCSGTIVNSYGADDEFYSTILTSATLIRCPEEDNAIANDIKVTVYLQDRSLFEGEILSYDFHFNFAAIQIKSGVKLKTAVLGNIDDYTKCAGRTDHSLRFQLAPHLDAAEFIKLCPGMEVIALGRYYDDPYHIMAAPGKLMFEDSELDCEELRIASSEITKNGIGGPLITYNGCVIGLNFYKPARTPFLPINIVLKCLEHLLKYREVPRPWLGLEISDLDRAKLGELEKLRLSCPDTLSGILVRKVEQRSPASDAGICTEDVIVQIDDKDVGSSLKVEQRSPASDAGICTDDVIVQIDDKDVGSSLKFASVLLDKANEPFKLFVKRASGIEPFPLDIFPQSSRNLNRWPLPKKVLLRRHC